jgi:hypothetical protein
MALMLELPPDVEARLRRKAERAVQGLPDYLLAVADAKADEEETDASEGSAADLFAGRIGRFRSGGDGEWSENCGEKFAEGMAKRRRRGRL